MERQQRRKEEDYDEEVEEDLQDEHETDVHILSKVRITRIILISCLQFL